MPYNEIIHPSCNIVTNARPIFTKFPSSKLQECLGKLLVPLDLIQIHPIVIVVCNEWVVWLHNIWVCNGNTSFLMFHYFIFPHNSPIISLLRLWHLDRDFFLYYNYLLHYLHFAFCWDIGITTCYQDLPHVTCHMNS